VSVTGLCHQGIFFRRTLSQIQWDVSTFKHYFNYFPPVLLKTTCLVTIEREKSEALSHASLHFRFLESASSYIKMINETKDLRSALLLEQVNFLSFTKSLILLKYNFRHLTAFSCQTQH